MEAEQQAASSYLKQLAQSPGPRQIQRLDGIRDDDNLMHSREIDGRERSVDLRQLQDAPLPGQLQLESALTAAYVEESAQAFSGLRGI